MKTEEIIQALSKQGLRITDQRKTLAALFVETTGYLTPKDVYDYMALSYSGLSFDTVYRNLRLMNDLGILEQFVMEDGIKFRLHCNEHHHHHHLICVGCDRTIPIIMCPMTGLDELPESFQVVNHKFEIYGYCQNCQTP